MRVKIKMETKSKEESKTFLINGHEWFFRKELKRGVDGTHDCLEFTSNWLCNDNDAVSLYIDDVCKDYDGGFVLECFSGIPASTINIDTVDFTHIQYIDGFPKEGFWEKDYLRKCLIVADFICSKFCRYSISSVSKINGVYAVDINWNIKHDPIDLNNVMKAEDCRFIGTKEECELFLLNNKT